MHSSRTDYVIIPEPLNVDRICVGHRGVYWFEVDDARTDRARQHAVSRRSAPSSTWRRVIDELYRELVPTLLLRTTDVPVVPELARHPTLNVNGIEGGQPVGGIQTPCVPTAAGPSSIGAFCSRRASSSRARRSSRCSSTSARRTPDMFYEIRDLMVVHPVLTPDDSPVIDARRPRDRAGARPAGHASSPVPGTYDHKHVDRIGGIRDCVAYGPGHPRSRASAGRMVRRGRPDQRDEGSGPEPARVGEVETLP